MPIPVITSIISACSILAGSAMGAWFSWLINNKMHKRKMEEEYDIIKDNRNYEEKFKIKELCANANVIRLDICTAIYQSIRGIVNDGDNYFFYPVPINKNYSCSVASLSDKYSLKELSYLYQLYGIIEKVNNDILKSDFSKISDKEKVIKGFKNILIKIYGKNIDQVLKIDIDNVSYELLSNNEYIKEGYKNLLNKLNYLCVEENVIKEKISNS